MRKTHCHITGTGQHRKMLLGLLEESEMKCYSKEIAGSFAGKTGDHYAVLQAIAVFGSKTAGPKEEEVAIKTCERVRDELAKQAADNGRASGRNV